MTSSRAGDIQAEFARQADSMLNAPRFTNATAIGRLRDAVAATSQMRVLDLACGPGIVTEALAPDAALVVGLDITPVMLQRAAVRAAAAGIGNAGFALGDCTSLPFADSSFDAVVSRSAVHHFFEPAAVFREVSRVLRAGGAFVISDVVSSEERQESALHNALETLRDPTHARMLPESELLGMLTSIGFRIETAEPTVAVREFDEWLAITSAPERIGPLRVVMEELAEAGVSAGVNLRTEDGRLLFDHRTVVVRAVRQD